jgi:hypothetical protein
MKKVRNDGATSQRPSTSVSVAKNPIRNEQVTLTTSVPNGNASPKWRATKPDAQNRATLPSAPPKPTQK